MASHVEAFLNRHSTECYVSKRTKQANNTVLTHTFWDNTGTGKLRVPPTLEEAFRGEVAKDVAAGTLPGLNELRTDVFRFFVDVDAHLPPSRVEGVTAAAVGACCVREVKRFVTRLRNLRCVVLATPDRPPDDKGRVKRGMHLHFPALYVTTHEALTMREALVVALKRDVADDVDWVNDVDNAPYVNATGGLRVVGAPKAIDCPQCKDKPVERKECLVCMFTGKKRILEYKYALSTVLDDAGNEDAETHDFLRGNVAALVAATSVRSTRTQRSPEWACFDGCPVPSEVKKRANAPPKAGSKERTFAEEKRSLSKWPKVPVVDADKIACLRTIFRTRFLEEAKGVYSRVEISNVQYSPNMGGYFAQFSDEGESYCMNVARRHNSNRVYGVVDRTHAYVRCHCNCVKLEGRLSGKLCRDFKSPAKQLTQQNVQALFASPPVPFGFGVGVGAGGGVGRGRGVGGEPPSKKAKGKMASAAMAATNDDDYLANLSQTLYAANHLA